jgi:hypothetical protein
MATSYHLQISSQITNITSQPTHHREAQIISTPPPSLAALIDHSRARALLCRASTETCASPKPSQALLSRPSASSEPLLLTAGILSLFVMKEMMKTREVKI